MKKKTKKNKKNINILKKKILIFQINKNIKKKN